MRDGDNLRQAASGTVSMATCWGLLPKTQHRFVPHWLATPYNKEVICLLYKRRFMSANRYYHISNPMFLAR